MGDLANREKSRIKMVIMKKHGHDNAVWWSPIKYNAKPAEVIIAGMIRRFKLHPISRDTNKLLFFENDVLIAEHNFNT